ncbi:MAG: filamentous hemagglutinin N-terminal domain-containing protein, partial [Planctomycetota bacterium]|nr:filamentous hemagglutinin N-terminal domain-containing protein [Planctomycetota bacterium]
MRPSPFEVFGRVSLAFLSLFIGLPYDVWAGPQGAQVVHGQVQFQNLGAHTNITASDRAIINFQSFNLSSSESVRFLQPHINAWVLNRILASSRSEINGRVTANGGVVFVNPNGIYFGPNSTIDVNRLVASSHNISNESFLGDEWLFDSGQGDVIVDGEVRAANGAYLIGQHIINNGSIFAPGGAVVMAAGDRVMLRDPDGSLMVEVDGKTAAELRAAGARPDAVTNGSKGTAIKNTGEVEAKTVSLFVGDTYSVAFDLDRGRIAAVTTDGSGKVEMAAESGRAALGGTIEGDQINVTAPKVTTTGTLRSNGGRIEVEAGTDNIFRGATVDASSIGAKVGGFIELLGVRVGLFDSTTVDASGASGGGTVHIGGEFQGKGETRRATQTVVGAGSEIRADALSAGDGGTVIVWSDENTRFYGEISARGGPESGNGGIVEVSGKFLEFAGFVDASAEAGIGGSLLLDPHNITIANGGTDTVATNNDFAENSSGDVSFDADLITAITNTGTGVTLQANTDVRVLEDIITNNGGGNGGNITLQAGRSVLISANIDTDDGDLSITANETTANGVQAGNRDAGVAEISITAGGIDAGNGSISMVLSTGAGLGDNSTGNITVRGMDASAGITLTNNGP